MKVENINHIMISQHRPKSKYEDHIMGAGLCDNQSVSININKNKNTGYYNGSFTGKEKAAVSLSSRMLEGLIDACNNHTTIVQNLVALVLALGPRPLAILSLPGKKNKEDKIYASGHSMASGLIGFAFASIIMYPLGIASKKVREHDAKLILDTIEKSNDIKLVTRRLSRLAKSENIEPQDLTADNILKGTTHLDENFIKQFGEYEEKDGKVIGLKSLNKDFDFEKVHKDFNAENFTKEKLFKGAKYIKGKYQDKFLKNFFDKDEAGKLVINKKLDFDMVYKAINMAPDTFVFGILKAMLTVALIPPILKYVFGIEKSKPQTQQAQTPPPAPVQQNLIKSKMEEIAERGNK